MEVEAAPARHPDHGRVGSALCLPPESHAHHEAVDVALDDRPHVAGRAAQRPPGEAAPAGLVPGEARPVHEEDARPSTREMDGRRRAGGPGTDDDGIESLHPEMVGGSPAPLRPGTSPF
jgi:hypothetical protein